MADRPQTPTPFRWAATVRAACGGGRRRGRASILLLAAALLAGASPAAARGESDEQAAAGEPLSPPHREWLEAIAPLLSDRERDAFLAIRQDYRRQAFIEQFWRVRDPYPETARNERREQWETLYEEARQRFGGDDGGARIGFYAAIGEPSAIIPGRCPGVLDAIEIWRYPPGAVGSGESHLVFRVRDGSDGRRYQVWSPSEGLYRLTSGPIPGGTPDELLSAVATGCFRGDEVARALASAVDWRLFRESEEFSRAGEEWLGTFLGRSTELPEGAVTFDASLALTYPGRYQSRTVLQGLIAVPRDQAEVVELGKSRTYNFSIDGEVLRKGRLFESFRYRFQVPARGLAEEGDEAIPLLFQRYLRPGEYELVVRAQDLESERYFRDRRVIEVPAVHAGNGWSSDGEPVESDGGPAATAGDESAPERPTGLAALTGMVEGDGGQNGHGRPHAGAGGGGTSHENAPAGDPAAEANASLAAGGGEWGIRLLPPPAGLQTGLTRVEAVIAGDEPAGVEFSLDGRTVLRKVRPPYSVDVDLGATPKTHLVAAEALGVDGRVLARDELVINAGPHRFAVRLVEPQSGRRYTSSLRVQAEVDVPEGERLDRVELYLEDDLLATLYQPPFAHPLLLPANLGTAYVRAVAWLEGGHSAEDLVYINAPEHLDEIDVRVVELFTSALDRRGRPVDDLGREDFAVSEQGEPQEIRRFERVRDLPIWSALLLDRSQSMVEEIDEVVRGALTFFEQVLTPKDRAAVFTFNHQPELAVRFTSDPAVLAGGVAGISAEGGTALFDSLVQALYYFSGVNGKRTLILISDGDDGGSAYSFDDALDYAQRTGVAVYTIGLGLPGRDTRIRMQLQRLAGETGGRSFFISGASELKRVYETIEEELRTQYLLAYQSTYGGRDGGFRQVAVEVARPGVTASTVRGYYP